MENTDVKTRVVMEIMNRKRTNSDDPPQPLKRTRQTGNRIICPDLHYQLRRLYNLKGLSRLCKDEATRDRCHTTIKEVLDELESWFIENKTNTLLSIDIQRARG